MRDRCEEINHFLFQELEKLLGGLGSARVPDELSPYTSWLRTVISEMIDRTIRNLEYLDLYPSPDVHTSVVSDTQDTVRHFHRVNDRLAPPILKYTSDDLLAVRVLRVLHQSHPMTQSLPYAVASGRLETLTPLPRTQPGSLTPPIYYLPSSLQLGLRFIPLLFHEFGHPLFAAHFGRLEPLVRGLQAFVEGEVMPGLQRDDPTTARYLERARKIVHLWYSWAEELFCDAVALRIGGDSFLSAFSSYFGWKGKMELRLPPEEILKSSHPVSWLRVKFLGLAAESMGLAQGAARMRHEWEALAKHHDVSEDYFGAYEHRFEPVVREAVDAMTRVVDDTSEGDWTGSLGAFTAPLSEAWTNFRQSPREYPAWEERTLPGYLLALKENLREGEAVGPGGVPA